MTRPPTGSNYPPTGPVTPGYRDPRSAPPLYPPGREPIPPRRPRRSSPLLAPLLALLGLVLVGGGSLWAMGFLDSTLGDAAADATATPDTMTDLASADPIASGEPEGTADETPEPVIDDVDTAIVEPPSDERANVKGSILFTRSGDIWTVSGTSLQRLTDSDSVQSDAYPVWSPDGKSIYFIRATKKVTNKTRPGGKYTFYTPDLMRMKPDGSNRKKVFNSLIKDSRGLWFSQVAQPSVSSAGNNIAVVSDGPDGSADEVTLHIIDAKSGRLRKVATPTQPRLGHNDPAFSPDGTRIAFTYNDDKGPDGDPRVAIFTCRSKSDCSVGKVKYLKTGYANPSWSPDGKLLAVEATDGTGRDIVLVNARRGDVRVELTTDGDSFAPEFSPDGDQIAYLHRDGLDIDLRVMTLDTNEQGLITMLDDRPVTSDGGIDGISNPSWFIPPSARLDATPQESGGGDSADQAAEATGVPASDGPGDAPPAPPGA